MDRRAFLATAALAAVARRLGAATAGKAPYKLLYSNDTTNIISCASPFHAKGQAFDESMLRATVDEVPGVDAHLLQPGLGWIPWWNSDLYPGKEHYERFCARTGLKPDPWAQYMMDGGDLVKVFLDECRNVGQAPFVSLRMNDGHHLEEAGKDTARANCCSDFYLNHLDWRIGTDPNDWNQRVLNWAIPEVRAHKLSFIEEICAKDDIDGFELDFMRHNSLFRLDETPVGQRRAILAEFVGQVRQILDRTAPAGKRRWLCARVPGLIEWQDPLGVDLPAMVAAGLDMANLSLYYFCQQFNDLAKIRPTIPDAAVYLELCHTTTTGPSRGGYDSFFYRRTTDEQFQTTAELAHHHGADGISLFNFVYFREHGSPDRGPFNEPPFGVLPHLKDPAYLAKQPQNFYLGRAWKTPLPRRFKPGETYSWTLDMAPHPGRAEALLRLQTAEDSQACRWQVTVNELPVTPTAFVRMPFPEPYEGGLGEADQYHCYAVPRQVLKDGGNVLAVTLVDGGPVNLQYLEVTVP